MKKRIWLLATALLLSLAVCSCAGSAPAAGDDGNAPSAGVTMLAEGVWHVNEYTEGLPVPTGTVAWTMLDSAHRSCSIHLTGVSEADHDRYLALLKQKGFSVVERVTEEIEGQGYLSVGTLLSNGEKGLSISYVPDSLTLYISME